MRQAALSSDATSRTVTAWSRGGLSLTRELHGHGGCSELAVQLQLPTERSIPHPGTPSIPARRLKIFPAHLARLGIYPNCGAKAAARLSFGRLSSVQATENDVETFHSAFSKLCGISIRLLFSP